MLNKPQRENQWTVIADLRNQVKDHLEQTSALKKKNEDQAQTITNLKRALKESEADMDTVCKAIRIVERRERGA